MVEQPKYTSPAFTVFSVMHRLRNYVFHFFPLCLCCSLRDKFRPGQTKKAQACTKRSETRIPDRFFNRSEWSYPVIFCL